MKRKRRTFAAVLLTMLAALAIGCSSDDSPTSVSAADLQEGREFWLSLDPSLRRELAGICHDRQVKEGPSDAGGIAVMQGLDVDDYAVLIDRRYEDDTASASIEDACEAAKQDLLAEQIDQLIPHLRNEARRLNQGE